MACKREGRIVTPGTEAAGEADAAAEAGRSSNVTIGQKQVSIQRQNAETDSNALLCHPTASNAMTMQFGLALLCNAMPSTSCRHAAGSSGARGIPGGDGRGDAASEAVARHGIVMMEQHEKSALAHGKREALRCLRQSNKRKCKARYGMLPKSNHDCKNIKPTNCTALQLPPLLTSEILQLSCILLMHALRFRLIRGHLLPQSGSCGPVNVSTATLHLKYIEPPGPNTPITKDNGHLT